MAEIHVGMQYEDLRHQSDTALLGMWLFLATEILFFGALLFTYMIYRLWYPDGFVASVRHANMLIGTINTAVLLTSSVTLTAGLLHARVGDMRRLVHACFATIGLGLVFMSLKAVEYAEDFRGHLVPGADFALAMMVPGSSIYFITLPPGCIWSTWRSASAWCSTLPAARGAAISRRNTTRRSRWSGSIGASSTSSGCSSIR